MKIILTLSLVLATLLVSCKKEKENLPYNSADTIAASDTMEVPVSSDTTTVARSENSVDTAKSTGNPSAPTSKKDSVKTNK